MLMVKRCQIGLQSGLELNKAVPFQDSYFCWWSLGEEKDCSGKEKRNMVEFYTLFLRTTLDEDGREWTKTDRLVHMEGHDAKVVQRNRKVWRDSVEALCAFWRSEQCWLWYFVLIVGTFPQAKNKWRCKVKETKRRKKRLKIEENVFFAMIDNNYVPW